MRLRIISCLNIFLWCSGAPSVQMIPSWRNLQGPRDDNLPSFIGITGTSITCSQLMRVRLKNHRRTWQTLFSESFC
ncbi:hypothetical protein EV421DRAFT_1781603 [Armillaria borealis]|uniref:Secreted protein n=1 Tax=Armillaria borealis TaxID=47425 RepID=A0AA39JUW4_9AGAR|nr:hypothetical protein EV421DRAFT_1781603 [Armillaria borealis]